MNMLKVLEFFKGFKTRHSGFMEFLETFKTKPMKPNTLIEIVIHDPDDGFTLSTSIRLTEEDVDALHIED